MAIWIQRLWKRIRGSLWFVPGIMSLGAVLLAFVCALLDQVAAGAGAVPGFLYHGNADSARTLLSTVAGSMITVAGVSFSVTMVALSLASSQLGPRLLANFMRDPGNQIVLGGFIATFLFCLLALGSTPEHSGQFVSVSASVALMGAVGSLLLLIYFIHHIATSMQADYVIETVAADVDRYLRTVFPSDTVELAPQAPAGTVTTGALVMCPGTGYLQGVDEARLLALASEHAVCLEVLHRPGHYLTRGIPLVRVAGMASVENELERRIQRAFIVGGRRSADQDPEYGVHQLVEIALRALSPGINDPFTAMTCIDHLSGALAAVAAVPERPPIRWDDHGEVRVRLDPIDFAGVLEAAFNQIRQSAIGTASVSIRLLEGLQRIAAATRMPERLAAIEHQARMVFQANSGLLASGDRAAMQARFDELQTGLGPTGATS